MNDEIRFLAPLFSFTFFFFASQLLIYVGEKIFNKIKKQKNKKECGFFEKYKR